LKELVNGLMKVNAYAPGVASDHAGTGIVSEELIADCDV